MRKANWCSGAAMQSIHIIDVLDADITTICAMPAKRAGICSAAIAAPPVFICNASEYYHLPSRMPMPMSFCKSI